MKCPECQHENAATMKHCVECGARLPAICPACGSRNGPGQKFCGECGESLSDAVVTTGSPSVRGYTPKHLAEKILKYRSAQEGERKNVTVLFVDVVESSRLAEELQPEAMHEIMDRLLRLMSEMVHRYEGTVNQYLGDGLMALFGAPLALEDHALRAVQAALGIQETVSGYSEQLNRERGVEVRLRLGLNSGPVVVGKIGDDLRMDYTAIGDTTNLAARMEALAEPGAILVTDATHRQVEGYVRTEPVGRIAVKGRSELVSVFKVVGRLRRRSRLTVNAERGLTALIGREREDAMLQACLARAVAGRGQTVAVAGEPGIGKSRLLYEFGKTLGSRRVVWLEAHCAPDGQATPYAPIREIVGANFHIEEGDNVPQIEDKLRQGLRRLDASLERILPILRELFELPGEDETLRHLTPKDKRQKTFEAIRALTVAGSQRRPHVIAIEDLHWIDRTSEDFLAFLVDSLAGVPILLLTTHRPGYTVRWANKSYYTQIGLDQLSPTEVETMLDRLLGTRDFPADLGRRIYDKAEGNPLFVEEITTSLRERGLLVRNNGGFVWAHRAVVDFLGTVPDIIRARLDRLDEPVKRTVQIAAVIGRQFGRTLLVRVSDPAHDVEGCLATLERLELVHEAGFLPEPEYVFKHAVIQDVAYQGLLSQRRKSLHGTIGRTIEELYADRPEEYAAVLAFHYARSDQPDRAIRHALIAGDRAARAYANAEAMTHYQQALETARALPVSPEAKQAEIDAVLKLAAVSTTRQDIQQDRTNLHAAYILAEQLGDQSRQARVLYWVGRIEYVLGNPQVAIEYAERSLKIAERLGDDALTAPPVNLLGRLYWQQGALTQASVLLERSAGQMLRLENLNDAATTAGFAGAALADAGEFGRAVARADQGVHLADEIHNPFAQAAAHYFRGHVRSDRGEWSAAIDDFREARRIAEQVDDRFRVYAVKVYEGRAHTMMGDPTQGRMILEECIAIAEQIGTKLFLSRPNAFLAECLLALGEVESASLVAYEGVRLAEEAGERHGNALARRALAETLMRRHPPDLAKAEEMLLTAMRVQQENGEKPELARSYLVQANLLIAKEEMDKAREVLSEAVTMFRDMGMAWDLMRAEQMLRELSA
jgi:predicted ATPase/class 3 adenylate cyclase